MATTLFVMPLKEGKKTDYMKFMEEALGPRKDEYQELLKRYGLNQTKFWFHTLNGKDYVMFTHEMDDDGFKKLAKWSSSTHPFDQWFEQNLRNCYDFENLNDIEQPTFFGEINP